MSARVINRLTGKITEVKNLGWLLRHWREVKEFHWESSGESLPHWAGTLRAYLAGGVTYECEWADVSVCKDWLHRPVFRGCSIHWDGFRDVC